MKETGVTLVFLPHFNKRNIIMSFLSLLCFNVKREQSKEGREMKGKRETKGARHHPSLVSSLFSLYLSFYFSLFFVHPYQP